MIGFRQRAFRFLLREKLYWLGGASVSSQNTLREFCSGNFEKNILIFVPEFCAGNFLISSAVCSAVGETHVGFHHRSVSSQNTLREFCSGNFEKRKMIFIFSANLDCRAACSIGQ
ncbi:hypothetical protein HN393_01855 [bacterium]|nr:hypothetical protein [bacterium]MBT7772678.1 hypothetical protein [bacterium]